MNYRELLQPANLLSLSRVALAPVVGYCLWLDTPIGTVIAALMLILAGVTDALDGYLARRLNQVTPLGIALDPIADKLFAVILVGCLIFLSNLTGKWAFAAIAVLLGAYVIRFEFSIALMTPVVVILLVASLVSYGLVFARVRKGVAVRPFDDTTLWRSIRYGLLAAAAVAHGVMFYVEFIRPVG
jgi:phosphatidylserine synthase